MVASILIAFIASLFFLGVIYYIIEYTNEPLHLKWLSIALCLEIIILIWVYPLGL